MRTSITQFYKNQQKICFTSNKIPKGVKYPSTQTPINFFSAVGKMYAFDIAASDSLPVIQLMLQIVKNQEILNHLLMLNNLK